MNEEKKRLNENKKKVKNWKKWGPYLTERQWGTVREDYSKNGDAWNYTSHDFARSRIFRWGEEGIGGICDENQLLCFALAFWNGKDPMIKERFFGLTNYEGNHGEDVKEYYYYLDNTPTHSYMKMLYKYPQQEFPYNNLIKENKERDRNAPEFELIDTGIFSDDKYFDIFIEYAKLDAEDILIKISAFNRSRQKAEINIIPTVWFRNTWAWGYDDYKPTLTLHLNRINVEHQKLGKYKLFFEGDPGTLFCNNETNVERLYGIKKEDSFYKDGINNFIITGNREVINSNSEGTKAGLNYKFIIPAKKSKIVKLRLTKKSIQKPFINFDENFNKRIKEAGKFFKELQLNIKSKDQKNIQRQAIAGMLWNKQFYYYDIPQWLNGDPAQPPPPAERKNGRNSGWFHLNNFDIISMPDTWEYPWYAAWDLAFHCIPISMVDAEFAKNQLLLLTKEWYMHPNGEFPAYEWNFSDSNPPVFAWAAWRVYKIDKKQNNNTGDYEFLESMFHKLLLNFTWWVNRKDMENNNIFQGGFLGLDNIGVFDRSKKLPNGRFIEQADATSWMAMYCLNLMRIALELSSKNPVYQDLATKFFEHFLYIANAMVNMGSRGIDLWDDKEEFFFDVLKTSADKNIFLRIRSIVGLIPLFAVEVLDIDVIKKAPEFERRLKWFLDYRPDLAKLVSRWTEPGKGERRLLSLLRGHRMKCILRRMLDETEFLSDYGVRSLSRYHKDNPYKFYSDGSVLTVDYEPAESATGLFGGNSNWRGPIWFPINFLIIESLQKFYHYYGNDFKIEYPTNSGKYFTIKEISEELSKRLFKIFLKDKNGNRPVYGKNKKLQKDPYFKDYLLFYEYFHGDNGSGLGASHQTGWTGLIAKLLQPKPDD